MPIVPERGSAKFLLRLPPALHGRLKNIADEQGVSVNTLLVSLLAGGIGWKYGDPIREDGR